LNPEPVRFYGNTTSAVSVETEQWMEEKGYNLDQIAPVRIRGSLVPEKGVSTLGWTLFWLAAVLMLVWFVYLLMENWQIVSGDFYPRSMKFGKTFAMSDDDAENKKIYDILRSKKHKVICINDMVMEDGFPRIRDELRAVFEEIFPQKSSFEK